MNIKKDFRFSSIVVTLTCLFWALVVMIPPIVVFLNAFKSKEEFFSTSRLAFPQNLSYVENFTVFFREGHFVRGLLNTSVIILFTVLGNILLGSMVAYALGRFRFRLRNLVFGIFILAMMVPYVTTQVTVYGIMQNLHLFDSLLGLTLLYLGADIVTIYIFLQFVNNIPISVDEAALIDGASLFQIFFRIILPLMKPAIATVAIIRFVKIYNDFYIPYLYLHSSGKYTVSLTLLKFRDTVLQDGQWQLVCAGVVAILVPSILLFLFFQKYIYAGITAGSVK